MKKLLALCFIALSLAAFAAESTTTSPPDALCPITGKPANPAITSVYEGVTYCFADDTAKKTFDDDRAASIYHAIGGNAAIEAAVERFYVKVLADDRVKHYFEDISMEKQKRKQKAFLSMAFGAPTKYVGKDLRKAHADLPGLNETHFNAIAEHLHATLVELNVPKEQIARIMVVLEATRADVLNRPAKA